jgi:hypothetical protein
MTLEIKANDVAAIDLRASLFRPRRAEFSANAFTGACLDRDR